ncbi:hypothetical protein STCU_11320 [Strigomonas culicis]|uniref:Uncharacterized protein n=1 Tax=Strigomonas culicis TaxID=28005 RepID=S9TEA8_9TRYP|nr:hypothetical protein STCU_11320 [Strigomonas culicis]|eukprot:EPY16392.1 hypothetical protein STCU_11320 [Strigomonas culicis]
MPDPAAAQKMFRFLFYTTALLFLLLLYPFTDSNSPMFTMQGLPWWELPVSSASCFLLLRALYPRAKENEIKEEYEAASRTDPFLTFDAFLWSRYPNLFDGYANNQHMAIAMVATCLSRADKLDFAKTVFITARKTKDVRKSVDDIVEVLSRHLAEAQ